MSSPTTSKTYQVLDVLLKLVATASLIGIIIIFALRTAKFDTHVSDIGDQISSLKKHLDRLSFPISSSGELVVSFSSGYSMPRESWSNPLYIRNA